MKIHKLSLEVTPIYLVCIYQPVSTSISSLRIVVTFALQGVFEVAIWAPFTHSFDKKIQTNSS